MHLSKQSIEILLDLVEIKLGALMVQDREDAREMMKLQNCKAELLSMLQPRPSVRAGKAQLVTHGGTPHVRI